MTKHQLMVHLTGHCESATRLASESRDRRLTLLERVRLLLHLRMCSWCTRAVAQIALLAVASRMPPKNDAPLPDAARQRIAQVLQDME